MLSHGQQAAAKLDALLNAAATASEYDVGFHQQESRCVLSSEGPQPPNVTGKRQVVQARQTIAVPVPVHHAVLRSVVFVA